MTSVKRIVLDVLKPHQPNVLEFALKLAACGQHRVRITVTEMDEQTESVVVEIDGASIDFELINKAIHDVGGSLHSIDEVEVDGDQA